MANISMKWRDSMKGNRLWHGAQAPKYGGMAAWRNIRSGMAYRRSASAGINRVGDVTAAAAGGVA